MTLDNYDINATQKHGDGTVYDCNVLTIWCYIGAQRSWDNPKTIFVLKTLSRQLVNSQNIYDNLNRKTYDTLDMS